LIRARRQSRPDRLGQTDLLNQCLTERRRESMVSYHPAESASGSARVSERLSGRRSADATASRTASNLSPAEAGTYYIVCVWSPCRFYMNRSINRQPCRAVRMQRNTVLNEHVRFRPSHKNAGMPHGDGIYTDVHEDTPSVNILLRRRQYKTESAISCAENRL